MSVAGKKNAGGSGGKEEKRCETAWGIAADPREERGGAKRENAAKPLGNRSGPGKGKGNAAESETLRKRWETQRNKKAPKTLLKQC